MGGFVERWHQFRRSMSRRTPHTKTEHDQVKIEDELGSNSATLPLEVLPLAEVDTTGFSRKKTLSWPRRMLRKSFRKNKKAWNDSSQDQNSLPCAVASSCEGQSGTTAIDEADCPDKSLNANCQLNLAINAIVRIGEDFVSDGTVQETAKPSTTTEQHESRPTDTSNVGAAREIYLLPPTTPPLPVSHDDQSSGAASDRLSIQNIEIVPDLSSTRIGDGETLENLPSNYGSFVESLTDSQALNSTHSELTELGAPCNYSSMASHGQGEQCQSTRQESPCVLSVSSTENKSSSEAQSLSPAFLYDGRMSCSSDDLGCDEIPKQNHKKLGRRFSNTSVRSNSSWLANIGPNFSRGWSYKENRRLRKLSNSSLTYWQRSVCRRPSRVQKLSVPIIMVNNNQKDLKNQANISYLTASGNSSSLETQASRKLSSDDLFSRKTGINSTRFSSLRAYPSWIKNKEQIFVRGWSTKKSQKSQLTGSNASRLSVRKSLLRRNALKTHTPVQSDISRIVRKNSLAADAGKRVRQKPRRDIGTTSNTGTYGKDRRRKNSDPAGNKSKKVQNISEASVRSKESSNSGETLKASWSSLSSCGDVITPSTCRCHSAQSSEDGQELAAPKGPNGPTTACGSKRAPALNSSGPPAPGSLNYWSAGAVDSSAASESGALPMQRPPCACAGGYDARHHGHHHVRCDSTHQSECENGLAEDLSRAPIVLADHSVKILSTQRSTRCSSEGCVATGKEMSEMRDVNCESNQVSDRRSLLRYSASFNSKLLDRETDVSKILNIIHAQQLGNSAWSTTFGRYLRPSISQKFGLYHRISPV